MVRCRYDRSDSLLASEAPLPKPPARATVLVVCTANVCRSPRAEYVLQEVFARSPRFEGVRVASVGTATARAAHICDLVREVGEPGAAPSGEWETFADDHRSAPLTTTKIAQAKLILTAGREHRGSVAKIDPDARARTFTLREALLLGEGFQTTATGTAAIAAFAEYADAQRGMRTLPASRRQLFGWRRSRSHPLSIADTHGGAPKVHRATIADVTSVSFKLAALVTGAAVSR